MSAFSNSLGASRACADFRDPTAVSRLKGYCEKIYSHHPDVLLEHGAQYSLNGSESHSHRSHHKSFLPVPGRGHTGRYANLAFSCYHALASLLVEL
jgi:hypothetical protein